MNMSSVDMYWLDDKSAPFATFLTCLQSYYHPEVRNDNFAVFAEYARRNPPGDAVMVTFKQELVRLLQGDREGLHPAAIGVASEYDDFDTDDEFLAWLWQELYPEDPVPGPGDDGAETSV
jgi:hypothetical protein